MSETQSPEAPPRRLHRSSTDRMVAGVCGGLADYTGIDPVVFRVVFAVAAVLGGAGLAAYLVAWLVIPEEQQGASHAEALLRERQIPRFVLIGAGILGVLLLADLFDGFGPHHFWHGGFSLIILLGLGIWLWNRREHRPPAPPAPTAPAIPPTPGIATPVPPAAPMAPRPPRERSALAGVTISAALVVIGLLAAIATAGASITGGAILAGGLITLGAGLLVGSTWGRARVLIPLAIVLTMATAVATVADVPFKGGAGDRTWRPTSTVELGSEYHLGAGHGQLDLRKLTLNGETHHVTVTLGMGHLELWLPPTATVDIKGHVGAGRIQGIGTDEGGTDENRHVVVNGPDGRLVLDAKVGLGFLEVHS